MPRNIHRGPDPTLVSQPSWLVEYKRAWGDAWQVSGNLIPQQCERHTLSMGVSSAVLLGRYGPAVKQTWQSQFYAVGAPDFDFVRGMWVRISLYANGAGRKTIFVGRVEREDGAPQGSTYGAQGDKLYYCIGPEFMLEKDFHQSYWDRDGTTQTLDWLPSFNNRDDDKGGPRDRKRGLGNKAARREALSVLFGGAEKYSHYDVAELLLNRYVVHPGGPAWRIAGQTKYLTDLTAEIETDEVETVADLLRRVVDVRWGLDAFVRPYEDTGGSGFELVVFALLAENTAWGGYSYPLNPSRTSVSVSTDPALVSCQIDRDGTQLYDRVRVVGARTVSVFTMNASQSGGLDEPLLGKWDANLEQRYKDPYSDQPSKPAAERDGARAGDEYRDVYQLFGASDTAFDWNDMWAVPYIAADGSWVSGARFTDYQRQVRRTLSWLPLREGWDYSGVPAGPASDDPNWRPPFALVQTPTLGYRFVDQLNAVLPSTPPASVQPLEHDWGVRLRSTPNHVFARGQGMPANKSQFDADVNGVNWRTLVVTIAAETDYRLRLEQDLPLEVQSGLGRVKIIHAPQLQFWYLAPGTVWSHDRAGTLLRAPQTGTVLRNDADHAARIMAGAIARFLRERLRATLTYKLLTNWNAFLGYILETNEAGVALNIGSPVSSVSWDFVRRTTTIQTGQAIGTGQGRQRAVLAARRPRGTKADQRLPGDAAAPRRRTKAGRK